MARPACPTVRSSVAQFLSTAPQDVKVGVVSFGDQATQDLVPTSTTAARSRRRSTP